jgi:hypothetical protein
VVYSLAGDKEMQEIAENLARIRERIAAAAAKSGRKAEEILLVAVSKGVEPERIEQAIGAGVTDLGENYLQEAIGKKAQIGSKARWHFIGHLQRNKVNAALEEFSLIQSVDSLKLAQEISRRAAAAGKTAQILLQVNTSSETSKFGVAPEETLKLVEEIGILPGLALQGLMTIGRFEPDAAAARGEFRLLAQIFREISQLNLPNIKMRRLSMGMTHDFEVAIEEGANLVRIGTGIFGPRREKQ